MVLLGVASPAMGSLVIPLVDDDLVVHADAIVVGAVARILSHEDPAGNIATYVTIDLDEVLKGPLGGREVTLRELGGSVGPHHAWVFANPNFVVGERVLVFLNQRADGTLRTYQFYLGKFTIVTDPANLAEVAVRDVPRRTTVVPAPPVASGPVARPLDDLRALIHAKGGAPPPPTRPPRPSRPFVSAAVPLTGSTQSHQDFRFLDDPDPPTPVDPNALLIRWFEPDGNMPITVSINAQGEPAAPTRGFDQIRAALRAWSTVPSSSFRFVEAGTTSAAGFVADGVNAISFRDPRGDAMDPVGCRGILAVGGISRALGPITDFSGRRFLRALEADVVFNNGWDGCGFFYENFGNFTEVATHELGHALGLGHSAAASLDARLGHAGATMQAIAHFDGRGNRLHVDDQAGVSFLYPGQTLTIRVSGLGHGTIVSSPTGISCGSDCVAGFAQNSTVTLHVTPAFGSQFTGFVETECGGAFTMVTARTCTATFALDPDLTITALTAPTVAAPGDTIQVGNTVRNSGRPAPPFSLGFFLSRDATITRSDELLAMRRVNGLATNAVSPATTSVQIPFDTEPGAYFLGVMADVDDEVDEGVAESNNTRAVIITIVKPDLIVTALTTPATAGTGRTITVTSTVKNLAGAAVTARPSTLAFYLSTDAVLDPGDRRLAETRAIAALPNNATSTAATVLTIPADVVPGAYYLIAVADDLHAVDEREESNNTRASSAPLLIRRPDLSVASVTAPSAGAAGQDISVTHVVRNLAQAPATAPVSTSRLFLSSNPGATAGVDLGTVAVPAIPAGGQASVVKVVKIPPATASGRYWIFARANEGDTILEGSVGGNIARTPAPVIVGPDLVVDVVRSSTPTTAPGMTLPITTTVRNQGGQALGGFDVGVYLSLNGDTYDVGDQLLARRRVVGLAARAATTLTIPIVIPPGTPAGSAVLIVRADMGGVSPTGEVAEADETNNTRPLRVEIVQPDLAVLSVSTTPATRPGANISVSTVVKNLAAVPGRAPVTTVRLYLSAGASLDVSRATMLGETSLASLAGQATATATRVVTIPATLGFGRYWLFASVNSDGAILETGDGLNNVGHMTNPLLVGPDLVIVAATAAPSATAPGMPVSVTATIKNQGGLAAGAFDVGVSLSTSGLATRRISGLPAQAAIAVTLPITLPAVTTAGPAVLTVRTDAGGTAPAGEVEEADETNNGRAVAVEVVRPDLVVQSTTTSVASAPGGHITLTTVVKNLAAPAGRAPATHVRWFLSSDSTPSVANDTALADAPVASLPGLATATLTKAVTLPGSIPLGRYWIKAQVDPEGVVPESDATNNVGAQPAPVLIGADLVLTGVVAPPLTGRGATVPVTTTVKNVGGQTANGSVVSFFLTRAGQPEVRLGATRVVPPLVAGAASGPAVTMVTIPIDTAFGDYLIRAQVDGNAVVHEADETDNARMSGPITVAPPDLRVISITPPIATIRGRIAGARPISVVVRNLGPGPSAPFDLSVYASATSDAPGDGDLLFTRPVGVLAVNASMTLSGPAVVPESVAGQVRPIGDYFVSAIADRANATGTVPSTDARRTATVTMGVLPDLGRLSSAAARLTLDHCSDPAMNATSLDLIGAFRVSAQTLSSTQKSSTFTASMSLGNATTSFAQSYTVSGQVTSTNGLLTSSFAYRSTSGAQVISTGVGSIGAQLSLLGLDGALTGHDTSAGDTCTFSGSVTIDPTL